jgi:hypothetical protein
MNMSLMKFFGLRPAGQANAPESRPATEPSMTTQSHTNVQRELIRVVLKATLRQHGIPTGWISCDVAVVARRSGGKKTLYVHLIVQHWNQALMNFAPELQHQLMQALDQFEPNVDHSNYIVSWRFSPECGCPYTRMPDPMFWLQDAEPIAKQTLPERASLANNAARPKFDLPPSSWDKLP